VSDVRFGIRFGVSGRIIRASRLLVTIAVFVLRRKDS
jgi:hypothetical protein